MSRRIEIELTSARPDGTWTWRAAGAREPKGVLDGGLLHGEAKPGDVLKAEAEFELEGIVITSVLVPKQEHRAEPQRIEVVGPGRPVGPGVTTQLVGRSERRPGDRRRDRDDGGRRRERGPGGPPTGRPRREEGDRSAPAREGRPREGAAREGPESRESREGGGRSQPGRERRPIEVGRDRRPGPDPTRDRPRRSPADATSTTSRAERARSRRLNPGNAHRKAVLDSLPPEQQPIAEQVLRGGIPAVRTALHLEREKAQAEGRPAPNTDQLVAMAESLLPRIRAAEWRDRAEAAAGALDDISMRDLRSVVAGADLARDDETRALAATLREALEQRVTKLHQDWEAEIQNQLDANKVVRALRLSARPPEPTARLDAGMAERLATAAGEAMAPNTAPDLWAALLEAAAASPVRRSVAPSGLPENASPDLKRAAHQFSGNIPALAKLLGLAIPPPPAPVPARRRPDGPPSGGRRRGRGSSDSERPARTEGAGASETGDDAVPDREPEPRPQPEAEAAAQPRLEADAGREPDTAAAAPQPEGAEAGPGLEVEATPERPERPEEAEPAGDPSPGPPS